MVSEISQTQKDKHCMVSGLESKDDLVESWLPQIEENGGRETGKSWPLGTILQFHRRNKFWCSLADQSKYNKVLFYTKPGYKNWKSCYITISVY
jgi:hypothetical protein